MDIPASTTSKGETMKVKVWARRVWTLELSLVSLSFLLVLGYLRFASSGLLLGITLTTALNTTRRSVCGYQGVLRQEAAKHRSRGVEIAGFAESENHIRGSCIPKNGLYIVMHRNETN